MYIFIDQKNPNQRIQVSDQDSAHTLQKLLELYCPNQWHLSNEKPRASTSQEKRKHPRINACFRVIIVCGTVSFRSFSSNISLGGILLKHKLPMSLNDNLCDIYISNDKSSENIRMRCRIFRDEQNPSRLSFQNCDASSLEILDQWLHKESLAA